MDFITYYTDIDINNIRSLGWSGLFTDDINFLIHSNITFIDGKPHVNAGTKTFPEWEEVVESNEPLVYIKGHKGFISLYTLKDKFTVV
jgi:hypothetical protein